MHKKSQMYLQKNVQTLGLLDQAGHDSCFGCPEYYDALDIADNYIQEILKTLRNTKTPSGNIAFCE